jgi:hypothetical protein
MAPAVVDAALFADIGLSSSNSIGLDLDLGLEQLFDVGHQTASPLDTKLTARPEAPARPVRPMRWT